MPLFHPSVIEKHVKNAMGGIPIEHQKILARWRDNLESGILDSEISNDSEFIQNILINVLGYKGNSFGNDCTVAKNIAVGTGNVDVALGHYVEGNFQVIAPFELKGAKTLNLDAIMPSRAKSTVNQAWEYAMDAKGAKWVMVTNFREIRLYGKDYGRRDYERFDLSELMEVTNYHKFILLLSPQNLLSGYTLSLLQESENKNKEITASFYRTYKELRSQLIDNLISENTEIPPLEIVKLTQTILDRMLFVAFSDLDPRVRYVETQFSDLRGIDC